MNWCKMLVFASSFTPLNIVFHHRSPLKQCMERKNVLIIASNTCECHDWWSTHTASTNQKKADIDCVWFHKTVKLPCSPVAAR